MSVERILVLNLTRFGDLLQTSPTIADLRARHPGAEITVAAERNFADVCEGIPGIDRIHRVDLDALAHLLLAGGDGLLEAHRFARDLVGELRDARYDLAFNFSSSRMSAVLMGLLRIADVRGWTMTGDGYRNIRHPWSRLFAVSCLNRRMAPFNLVDAYRSMADGGGGIERLAYVPPAAARDAVRARLSALGIGDARLVALQLGASREVRRWPLASFVELARRLCAEGLGVVLVGGAGDRAQASELAAAVGRGVHDFCGRTSIGELGALLERVALLVTGDTGPMHMAAAVGTPIAALFFGPALPFDTGPYGRDHVMLAAAVPCAPCDHAVHCLNPYCRDEIRPDTVAAVARARLAGDWGALEAIARRSSPVRIFRSGFDRLGYHRCEPLGGLAPEAADVLRWAYRATWLGRLRGAPLPEPFASGLDLAPFDGLEELADQGLAGLARMRAALGADDVDALAAAGEAVEAIDRRIARVGTVHAEARPLAQMFQFGKENLEDEAITSLLDRTTGLYRELAAAAGSMRALLGGQRGEAVMADAALR